MGINFHFHGHFDGEEEILKSLREIKELLIINKTQIQKLMSNLTDIQADIQTLGTTLDTLLTAIQGLSTGIDPNGISAADAAALKTSLDTLVAKAQADLAAIPTATPAIPPTEPQA